MNPHELGEPFQFTYNETTLTGSVHRSWGKMRLIAANDGEFYLEDNRKETTSIRQMGDQDRCNHCGHFFCTPDCPVYHNAPEYLMSQGTKVSIPDLVAIESSADEKSPTWLNDITFEGVVTDLKVFGANGSFKGLIKQASNPNIKIAVIFRKMNPAQFEGKLCRFSGKGMLRSDYKHKFGVTPQVSVGETTEVEIIGQSAHADQPLPLPQSTPDNGRDAAARSSVQSGGIPDESDEPLEERVETWFRAFGVVCRAAGAEPEIMKSSLTATDFKEITTGTIMSFKAAYGMHAKPHFRPTGYSQKELDAMPEQKREAAPGPEKVLTWKDQPHPKNGKKLSEFDQEGQLKLARWALTHQPSQADRLFHTAVLMMSASQRLDAPKGCLSASILSDPRYGTGFTDADITSYLTIRLGGPLAKAKDEDVLALVKDYDSTLEGIMHEAAKRMDNLDMSPPADDSSSIPF